MEPFINSFIYFNTQNSYFKKNPLYYSEHRDKTTETEKLAILNKSAMNLNVVGTEK